MTTIEEFREKWEERIKNRRAILGKQGFTDSHFGELYIVYFDGGSFVDVYVWTEHGVNEKDQHEKAAEIAQAAFPNLQINRVNYV